MAERPPKQQQQHSWAVYHLAARQKLVSIVHDQPNADAAIKQAIEEYNVPPKPDRGAEAGLGAALPWTPPLWKAWANLNLVFHVTVPLAAPVYDAVYAVYGTRHSANGVPLYRT